MVQGYLILDEWFSRDIALGVREFLSWENREGK